jgi:hypothetical protein
MFPVMIYGEYGTGEELSEKGLQIYEGSDIGARKLLQAVQRKLSDY